MDWKLGKLAAIALCGIIYANHAAAQKLDAKRSKDPVLEVCEIQSKYGAKVMQARQANIPMAQMMEIADSSPNRTIASDSRKIVIAAYEQPRWPLEEFRSDAIGEFQNTVYLACVKGGRL